MILLMYQIGNQCIASPTSVTNIDVTKRELIRHLAWCQWHQVDKVIGPENSLWKQPELEIPIHFLYALLPKDAKWNFRGCLWDKISYTSPLWTQEVSLSACWRENASWHCDGEMSTLLNLSRVQNYENQLELIKLEFFMVQKSGPSGFYKCRH